MHGKERLLSPEEAVEFLNKYRNANVTVDILRQMRRKGRVKGTALGKRMTVYSLKDLVEADITRYEAGRPPRSAKEVEA